MLLNAVHQGASTVDHNTFLVDVRGEFRWCCHEHLAGCVLYPVEGLQENVAYFRLLDGNSSGKTVFQVPSGEGEFLVWIQLLSDRAQSDLNFLCCFWSDHQVVSVLNIFSYFVIQIISGDF